MTSLRYLFRPDVFVFAWK